MRTWGKMEWSKDSHYQLLLQEHGTVLVPLQNIQNIPARAEDILVQMMLIAQIPLGPVSP